MATPRKKKKTPGRTKNDIQRLTLDIFNQNPQKTFNYKQIASALGYTKTADRQRLIQILQDLSDAELLTEAEHGKFRLNSRAGFITGKIEREGVKNYLRPDDGGDPIFIPETKMHHALNGDRVKIFLYARRKGFGAEGEVIEVTERAKDTFIGVLNITKYAAFLIVNNKILTSDIFIPMDKLNGGKNGQKAVVKIIEWPAKSKNPVGEVLDVLGDSGDNNTEMHAILAEYGLPYSYPAEIDRFAESISEKIPAEERKKRIDMRDVTTFTIDPKDAKDFDDALSIRKLKNGLWEVGVHIADVTHYVTPGDMIDKEAEKRATSIYLVDRTIPMLPERLSNFICSLRPDEEKLCYSAIFELNDEAQVQKYEIARTIIKSNRRFTYEEAQNVIETGEGDYKEEVLALDRLAKKLRKNRFDHGAIAFDRVEVRFDIDEKGKPVDVFFKESKDANKLVEEFMLLANKTVAEHIGKNKKAKKTFVYRIHDTPNPDKMANFSAFIKTFGYKLKTTGKNAEVSASINHLLDDVQGKKEQNLIETLAIRSMSKAVYSTENIGHYGLAFEHYTHFTSPIRRYPDMMVHRLLTHYAEKGKSVDRDVYEEKCSHCSEMEQVAANAERSSIKYKQVEYMKERLGMTFDGVISGVCEWGIYVELNCNKCEGMIPIRDLGNDYYILDEKNYCITGRKTGKKYSLGDPITVKVVKANLDKKQLDFLPV